MEISNLRKKFMRIPKGRWTRQAFILRLKSGARCLDVGCGNDSAFYHKILAPDTVYVGIDIAEYNMHEKSKKLMDEYYLVRDPQKFADEIRDLPGEFDAVISSHNIEHCNKPIETLINICEKIRRGGMLYLAYPQEKSVEFPSRQGTLNFYDDPTHIFMPKTDEICDLLASQGMEIVCRKVGYKPFYYWFMGGCWSR